jgi:DNA-binding response OmpR family regulator
MPARIPVLVIEDESLLSDYVEDILEGTRFDVVGVARVAADALALAATTRPRIAIVDLALEGSLGGLEAARLLEERFATAIVLVTGSPVAEAQARAAKTRPARLLRKPFLARQLLTLLEGAAAGLPP